MPQKPECNTAVLIVDMISDFEFRDGEIRILVRNPQRDDMTIASDGTIYLGENDVPYRSGYLWEITRAI